MQTGGQTGGTKLQIGVERAGDGRSLVLRLTGVIDTASVVLLEGRLDAERASGARFVVLETSGVRYVNSTGLGALVKHAGLFHEAGGGFALAAVAARVRIVIEMLGLEPFLAMHPSSAAALAALAGPEPARAEAPPPEEPLATVPGYPCTVQCRCGLGLELERAGRWRCPRCFSELAATPEGRIGPAAEPPARPLELAIPATAACGEGLLHMVTSVCRESIGGPALDALRHAVHEVCHLMSHQVYPRADGVYHVSVECQPGRVQIRFADSGATLRTVTFRHASRLAEFEWRPHPTGVGNAIRLVQTG